MPLDPSNVATCLVTRGDVDLGESIEASIRAGITEIVVCDNSRSSEDWMVYGRYRAIDDTDRPVIFVQDDDAYLPPESILALLAEYEPGVVVCNMPPPFADEETYRDSGIVGCGAVFDRDLPRRAFDRYIAKYPLENQGFFRRRCDNIFTSLSTLKKVSVDAWWMEWFDAPNRMWRQPWHAVERDMAIARAREAKADVAEQNRS